MILVTPVAPSDLMAAAAGGGAHLTWKDNSNNEETFEVMRNGTVITSLPFDTVQYHDATLTKGESYKYMVRAINKAGASVSNEVVFVAP